VLTETTVEGVKNEVVVSKVPVIVVRPTVIEVPQTFVTVETFRVPRLVPVVR